MSVSRGQTVPMVLTLLSCLTAVYSTYRYYQTYFTYGSGDTFIQVFHAHGGTMMPHKKWNVECLDGEAMKTESTWCKFTFLYKPPTNGLYPYYPSCHVRNFTVAFKCYDPTLHRLTSNTFVTAIQALNKDFYVHRPLTDDISPYKCCKTPLGYYIDYVSCYYVPTHDAYFEYYDSPFQFIVYCSQGYVMTGVAKKINPYTQEYRYDWIQCCRVGYGHPVAHPPPVTYMPSRVPAYYSQGDLNAVSPSYQFQYRTRLTDKQEDEVAEWAGNNTKFTSELDEPAGRGDNKEQHPQLELLLPARDIRYGSVRGSGQGVGTMVLRYQGMGGQTRKPMSVRAVRPF